MKKRLPFLFKKTMASSKKIWHETKSLLLLILILIAIRTFIIEPYYIPSQSMIPTLMAGDHIFVSKSSYGISRHSFPFSLFPFKGRAFFSPPKRGDIVVFKSPIDKKTNYIKRLIGLPGDTIFLEEGYLYINGQLMDQILQGQDYRYQDRGRHKRYATLYQETLDNGVFYTVTDEVVSSVDNCGPFIVPKNQYFVMGDNRDNSSDSRIAPAHGGIGFVHKNFLIGKAVFLAFSLENSAFWQIWRWPTHFRPSRFLKPIKNKRHDS